MQTPTNKIIQDLIKNGCYYKNTDFSPKNEHSARFLVVFAVPYGEAEGVYTPQEAIEAARELITADDWKEREWGVYDHVNRETLHVSVENLEYE